MRNKYRVDRATTPHTPCGMCSILYIGESYQEARDVFAHAQPGVSSWGVPDVRFGVVLSRWNERDYEVVGSKGLPKGAQALAGAQG